MMVFNFSRFEGRLFLKTPGGTVPAAMHFRTLPAFAVGKKHLVRFVLDPSGLRKGVVEIRGNRKGDGRLEETVDGGSVSGKGPGWHRTAVFRPVCHQPRLQVVPRHLLQYGAVRFQNEVRVRHGLAELLEADREKVLGSRCDSHLGQVFDDGPPPAHLRYCMNLVALGFAPRGSQQSAK